MAYATNQITFKIKLLTLKQQKSSLKELKIY